MPRSIDVRRSLALTGAFVLATWGTAALPATALEPGNGDSHANGQAKGHDKKDKKDDKSDKSDEKQDKSDQKQDKSDQKQDDTSDSPSNAGNKGGNGKGNKGGNGKGGGTQGDDTKGGGKGGDPAGNNGTVKITPHGEMDGIPQNTPHVDCIFDIEWYGFDEGADIISTVTFASHAPTSDVVLSGTDPSEVFVGGDPATGAGTETGFDGEQVYTLGFEGDPHPKQGYHIKLTINTPGSIGADTKHKVFWVQPCEETVEGTDDDTTDETDEDTDTEGTTDEDTSSTDEDTDDSTTVLGAQASADTQGDDTEVLGAQASAPGSALAGNGQDVPSAVDAGEEGNPVVDFVTSPLPLLVIGLGAALAGVALVSRRRNHV